MSVFIQRGSTALFALSVSLAAAAPLALGTPARAQEGSVVTAPPAPAPEAAPAPGVAQPRAVSRFGLDFALPPGMVVTNDSDRFFVAANLDAGGVGARIGLRVMTPDDAADIPQPGTPEYEAFLNELSPMPLTDSGVVIEVGGRVLHLYRGTAPTAGPDGTQLESQMLLMITQEAAEDGTVMMIGVFSAGLGAEVAGAIELDFITSLRASSPIEDTAPDTPDSGAGDSAVAPPAMAQAEVPGTVGEDADAAITSADAPAEPVELLPGLARYALPPGQTVATLSRNDRAVSVTFAQDSAPDVLTARIAGGSLNRTVAQQIERLLDGVDAVVDSDVGGLPVWVVYGPATRDLTDNPTTAADGVPARVIVPRQCVEESPGFMIALMATPGNEAALDGLQSGLSLSAPEGSVACDDSVIAPIRAAITPEAAPATTTAPADQTAAAPGAALPDGWVARERFGMHFAVPEGMGTRRERDEPDSMELWLVERDDSGATQREMSLRVLTPGALARLPLQRPTDPGFAAMLSEFADLELSAVQEPLSFDFGTMHVFRGSHDGGEDGTTRMIYLITEGPNAAGLTPWIALRSAGLSPQEAEAFETGFISNLGGSPELPEGVTLPPVTPPQAPVATPEPAPAATPEAQAWQAAQAAQSAEAMQAYLTRHPRGLNSGRARAWLHARGVVPVDEQRATPTPRPAAPPVLTETQAWAAALAQGRPEAIWTFLKAWPDGIFAAQARGLLSYQAAPPQPPAQAPGAIPYSPAPVSPGK